MNLDYSLRTPEERSAYVEKILACTPQEQQTPQYLQYLANYILFTYDKGQTKKERAASDSLLTKNRMATVDKRETSYEGLVSSLENGEDGLHNLIANDKNQILDQRQRITQKDLDEIPQLRQYWELIQEYESKMREMVGRTRYALKKQIIEIWQAMYMVKASHNGTPSKSPVSKNQIKTLAHMSIDEHIAFDRNQMPVSDNFVSLLNPEFVSFLLGYYSQLKEESYDDFQSDFRFMLLDLENLADEALEGSPILYDLLIWKIDGYTNEEIAKMMRATYGINHTEQYYSTLWRKRIPKLITEQAQKNYLYWYYTTQEYGQWKQCGKCGEIKLAHPMFFSTNTSKDSYYSVCKECRRAK